MKIYRGCHSDYFTLLPSISIGRGWIVIDWLWWIMEIT